MQDGDTHPLAIPTPTSETRLVRGLLLAGTLILLAIAVPTFPVPGTPPLSEMEGAVAFTPAVLVDCQTTWAGSVPMESCYWTLRLDDGKELAWPWEKSKEGFGYVREYLRANGPITVRHWHGRVYQIALRDGQEYLPYGDAYDRDRQNQWMGVILGFVVAATSLVRIGSELRYLSDPVTFARAGEVGAYLSFVCLGGALLLAVAATSRMWIGVVGLGLFAAIAPLCDQKVIRRAQAHALLNRQPSV